MSKSCARHELNAPGQWHVNGEDCVACDSCSDIAPQIFAHDERGISYIAHNLSADAEMTTLFREAADACPAAAIHESDQH